MRKQYYIYMAMVSCLYLPLRIHAQLDAGIALFEQAQAQTKAKRTAEAAQLYRQAISSLDASISQKDSSYEAHDYKGRAYEALNEPRGAYAAYKQGIAVFERVIRPIPDLYAPTLCLNMASIAKDNPKTMREALADLYHGESLLLQEWRKAQGLRANFPLYEWEQMTRQYQKLLHAFQSLEVDLLAADEGLLKDALPHYAEKYAKNPKDEVAALAYASMLQEAKPDDALTLYRTLLDAFPQSPDVRFCLSVFLERVAEGYYLSYETTANESSYQQFKKCYQEAYEMMQAAYVLNPDSSDILDALIRMSSDLGDDMYPIYKAKKQLSHN